MAAERQAANFALDRDVECSDTARQARARLQEHLARRMAAADPAESAAFAITLERVEAFALQALDADSRAVANLALEWRRIGLSRHALVNDLVPSAARRLGDWWCEDRFNFSEVTIGMVRLHSVVHHACAEGDTSLESELFALPGAAHCLITPAPGDQHTLGAVVLAEAFRNDGWNVTTEIAPTEKTLRAVLRRSSIDVLCISAAAERSKEAIARLLPGLRNCSLNPSLRILVGGPCFEGDMTAAMACGADGSTDTAEAAVALARSLLISHPKAVDFT
jgi:methylmalonyl-CoA mutase cobalamin-binding subunit